VFNWAVIAACIAAVGYATLGLYAEPVPLDWIFTFAIATLIGRRITFVVPGVRATLELYKVVTYSATLLLGPWAATILALIGSLPGLRRARNISHREAAKIAVAPIALLTGTLAGMYFLGPLHLVVSGPRGAARTALAIGFIASVDYLICSAVRTTSKALEESAGLLKTWRANHLRTLPGLLLNALGAGLVARAVALFGLPPVLVEVLLVGITYLIWKLYDGKVRASDEHIEKLTRLHLATIESLTMAIDAKDPAARGHIQRVRVLAEGLARAVGYPEDQMEGLKAAALLHDIGKLAIPEHILSKPGKLSTSEYSKIMVHPVVGADILSNVEFPYEVVPVVKHHHEKFDGTGYPEGLKGDQIPLGARILTVVDCYEALTTERSYRQRYTRAEALEMMRHDSGVTFDPAILEIFISRIDTIETALPAVDEPRVLAEGAGFKAIEPTAPPRTTDESATPTERALLNISAAQREVLSLYEISQTLGSTLKLSEVLPIVATKLEHVTSFTSLVIYLAEPGRLVSVHAAGKNADRLKGFELAIGEGSAGWVAEHCTTLIDGTARLDLEKPLGSAALTYKTATIFALVHRRSLVGAIALYCEDECVRPTDQVRMLESIALHATTAIHHALAFERTRESALTDSLTQLPNSRYMYSFFDQERSRAERHGYPLVLMMMDLDGFKRVNDTYGHHIGDEILRQVASIARNQLRVGDTLIRYAGDEFVAVLHRATPATIMDLKRRIQSSVNDFCHEVRPGRVARVGISIGHATYGMDGTALDELMEVADQGMYQDKVSRSRTGTHIDFAGQPGQG
jgi:diguanylate cyclase (GGDEF)-like protein/putative nucleotidyltransferase with HDIG domain